MISYIYLVLSILGLLLPYSQFVLFLLEHGLDLPLFFNQLFATRISAFFGWDVIVSALVLLAFIFTEGPRRGMKHLWVYALCTLTVGVSLGLPLFLYVRERRVAQP